MRYLVDTNVLLRCSAPENELYQLIRSAFVTLSSQGHCFVTTSQNLCEFWNVATRPINRNGFGLTVSKLLPMFEEIEALFPRLEDNSQIYKE